MIKLLSGLRSSGGQSLLTTVSKLNVKKFWKFVLYFIEIVTVAFNWKLMMISSLWNRDIADALANCLKSVFLMHCIFVP
jgi:hypothetical protein